MALHIRRMPSTTVRLSVTLMAVFALVVQPIGGFVSEQIASAMSSSSVDNHVVINEIFPSPESGVSEWIELYNPTNVPVELDTWTLKDEANPAQPLAGSIAAHGFATFNVDYFDNSIDTATLSDGVNAVDVVSYGVIPKNESYARIYDASTDFEVRSTPSRNLSNGSAPVIEPQLNAENFNAVDANYKGISVGFSAKDFGTVTSVAVEMTRADDSTVTKYGNQGLFDLISNKTASVQLTAPFVIQEGAFKEVNDTQYWQPAPDTWTSKTAPMSVKISITDENGTETVSNNVFNQGSLSWPTYESLLPPAPADTTAPATPTGLHRVTKADSKTTLPCGEETVIKRQVVWPTWNANEEADFDHYEYTSYQANGSVGTIKTFTTTQFNNHNWTPPQDGTTGFKLAAVDKDGNKSDPTEICYITYDSTAPIAKIVLPTSNGKYVRGDVSVRGEVDAREVNMKSHWFEIKGPDGYVDYEYNMNTSDTSWSFDWNTEGLVDGDYTLRYVATDKAGNRSDSTGTMLRTVTIDNTGPAVTGMRILQNGDNKGCSGYINQRKITVDWNSSDADLAHYEYQNKDGGTIRDNLYQSEFTGDIRDEDGYYKYRVRAVDVLGNEGAWTDWCGVTLDRDDPELNVNPIGVVGGDTLDVSGTAYDKNINYYQYYMMRPDGSTIGYSKKVHASVVNGKLASFDISKLESGMYTVRFTAHDKAGNIVDAKKEPYMVEFEIDHTEPVVALELRSSASPSANTPVLLKGNVTGEFASLKLFSNGVEIADLFNSVDDRGNWSYKIENGLVQGEYTLSVLATDMYGNKSDVTLPKSIVKISVGPFVIPSNARSSLDTSGLPAITIPATVATPTPVAVNEQPESDTDVLGTETTKEQELDLGQVAETPAAIAPSEEGWKFFGIAWYWWMVAAAVLAGIMWRIAAVRRQKQLL